MEQFDLDLSHNRLMRLLQPKTAKPGLLSVSPQRYFSSDRSAMSPIVPRYQDFSPINRRPATLKSLKRGLELFYQITGQPIHTGDKERKSEPIPTPASAPDRKKRNKSAKFTFVHQDKHFLEKLNTTLQQVLLKKKETMIEAPKPLSDIERLALNADIPRGRPRFFTADREESSEMMEVTVETLEGDVSPEKKPEDQPPSPPANPPDLSPSLLPHQSPPLPPIPLEDLPKLHLPSLSPSLPSASPQIKLRRIIDIPMYPFGKHRPIPEKVETLVLTPIEMRIRKKKMQLRQLIALVDSDKTEL